MTFRRLDQLESHDLLRERAAAMARPENHLKALIDDPDRLTQFSAGACRLFLDYSRQRLDASTRTLLLGVASELDLLSRFGQMCDGATLNITEDRAVLHTAARSFESAPILLNGENVLDAIRRVRGEIKQFSEQVHSGSITGSTGRRFRHVVVVGIGGSYLGTEFVSTALAAKADKGIALHYLSNVDIHNFEAIARAIDPPSTLWIIISKSFTTAETMANANQAEQFIRGLGLDTSRHMVTVTAKGSPGDDAARPVLHAFHMFDFIGGRYSVSSAVGGVPLSLNLGYDRFEAFLKGAAEMDRHTRTAPAHQNLPLLAALISVWNTTYLGYPQQAIIPYAAPLAKLAPHVQQLNMESNGKAVDIAGQPLPRPAGVTIFGEPGTNAQHSFFQLAHQGNPFPIDFIGVKTPQYPPNNTLSKGVTNHQELWANMVAQAKALAVGEDHAEPFRRFTGNRPSSTIVLDDLCPANIGRLLSFYEARTVFEGFIWGINSFDQFGVQLGKTLAGDLRSAIAGRNQDSTKGFDQVDPISRAYLEMLFS